MTAKKVKPKRNKKRVVRKEEVIDPLQKEANLPPGHRYDVEISNKTFVILYKAQIERIDHGSSPESTIKKDLSKIVKSKSMSRVATLYFNSILDMCRQNPFASIATNALEITYDENIKTSRHMKKFINVSMKERIDLMLKEAKLSSWDIAVDFSVSSQHPTEDKSIRLYKSWETRFDQKGNLTDILSIIVKSENLIELTDLAFKNGLLLYRDKRSGSIYHIVIFPENNIPALPLTPSKL